MYQGEVDMYQGEVDMYQGEVDMYHWSGRYVSLEW